MACMKLHRFLPVTVLLWSVACGATTTPAPIPTILPQATPLDTPSATPTHFITPTPTPAPSATPAPSLRRFAEARAFYVGAGASAKELQSDPLYAQILAREFNLLTPTNAMKFGPLRPSRAQFDFREADALVAFAEAHQMRVRGHVLVWDKQLPQWLSEGKFKRDELLAILRDHILVVVGRYRGKIFAWDVVNEAVQSDGKLRDSFWLKNLGPDYLELAFRWAHEADPDALLFYNDFDAEGLGKKSDVVYSLAQRLQKLGAPLHGVGLQAHVDVEKPPRAADVTANIKRLSALGVDVHITEMDVRHKSNKPSAYLLDVQARIYRDLFQACVTQESCKAFVTWGVGDRDSWIPRAFPGYGAALLFDNDYRPKPAYQALMRLLGP